MNYNIDSHHTFLMSDNIVCILYLECIVASGDKQYLYILHVCLYTSAYIHLRVKESIILHRTSTILSFPLQECFQVRPLSRKGFSLQALRFIRSNIAIHSLHTLLLTELHYTLRCSFPPSLYTPSLQLPPSLPLCNPHPPSLPPSHCAAPSLPPSPLTVSVASTIVTAF